MDRCTKKVLRYMLNAKPGKTGHCTFAYFYDDCAKYTGLTEHRVMASVRQLETDGYIQYVSNQHGDVLGFEFQNKAYHRHYYNWVAVRSFLFKSVLVPIIVSMITATATALLQSLWLPKLLNLLSRLLQ